MVHGAYLFMFILLPMCYQMSMSQAGADLDATDADGCTALEVCSEEPVMLLLTQALEAAEGTDGGSPHPKGGASKGKSGNKKDNENATGSRRRSAAGGAGRKGDGKGASGVAASSAGASTTGGSGLTSPKSSSTGAGVVGNVATVGAATEVTEGAAEAELAAGTTGVREEAMAVDLPEDRERMVSLF